MKPFVELYKYIVPANLVIKCGQFYVAFQFLHLIGIEPTPNH